MKVLVDNTNKMSVIYLHANNKINLNFKFDFNHRPQRYIMQI